MMERTCKKKYRDGLAYTRMTTSSLHQRHNINLPAAQSYTHVSIYLWENTRHIVEAREAFIWNHRQFVQGACIS